MRFGWKSFNGTVIFLCSCWGFDKDQGEEITVLSSDNEELVDTSDTDAVIPSEPDPSVEGEPDTPSTAFTVAGLSLFALGG